MKIETHNKLREAKKFSATRVLIKDDFGNPLALVVQNSPEHVTFLTRNQEGFAEALRYFGLDCTVIA